MNSAAGSLSFSSVVDINQKASFSLPGQIQLLDLITGNSTVPRASDDHLRDPLPTRKSLLNRLRDVGDNESWRTFFETYWRLLYNVARKSGLPDHHAQDVVQETVIAVARKMPDFQYDAAKGSFKQWLLLICRRRIHDHFRRAYSVSAGMEQGSDEDLSRISQDYPDPALTPDGVIDGIWEQEWRENIYHAALARVRQRIKPKHYQVFDYCVLQNRRPSDVARLLSMNAAQFYLAKHRVSVAIKAAVKELEEELGTKHV
jgi:RNA polymerase sigma-70 factor (ECF subfamily)